MLDKIKELVATCDSTNIKLAIAIGVNMEGYNRGVLEDLIIHTLGTNEDKLYTVKEIRNIRTVVYNNQLNIYGNKILGLVFLSSVYKVNTVRGWIDSYLSL